MINLIITWLLLGLRPFFLDSSLFVKNFEIGVVILFLYVDDITITGSDSSHIQYVIANLAKVFYLNDMGQLTYCFGLQIHGQSYGTIFVNQEKYITNLIHKVGMDGCKPCSTSC